MLKTVWSPAFPVTLSTAVHFSSPALPFCKMRALTVSSRTLETLRFWTSCPYHLWVKGEIWVNIWQSYVCWLRGTCSKGFLYLPVFDKSIFATWEFFGIFGIKVNELECHWWRWWTFVIQPLDKLSEVLQINLFAQLNVHGFSSVSPLDTYINKVDLNIHPQNNLNNLFTRRFNLLIVCTVL